MHEIHLSVKWIFYKSPEIYFLFIHGRAIAIDAHRKVYLKHSLILLQGGLGKL